MLRSGHAPLPRHPRCGNRDSIARYGPDCSRIRAARGIAGSLQSEQHGSVLAADEFECDWFVRMNNTGGPVDVWEVDGIEAEDLVLSRLDAEGPSTGAAVTARPGESYRVMETTIARAAAEASIVTVAVLLRIPTNVRTTPDLAG